MEKIKITPLRRFNRWFEKLKASHARREAWFIIDAMNDAKENLKLAYTLGYQQGVRDAKKGLIK
jgi:hypothetical protein